MGTIVTLTVNPAVDKSAAAEYVVSDSKVRCGRPAYYPGGGGINVSRAIQKLGGASTAVYPVGGADGATLSRLMAEEGVGREEVEISGQTRENLTVLEEKTGRQYRFGMPGPELSDDEVDACLDAVTRLGADADYVVASSHLAPGMPEDFYARLAQALPSDGAALVLDTSGKALEAMRGTGIHTLKLNLREFGELLKVENLDSVPLQEGAQALIDRGYCRRLVLSMGAAGALAVSDDFTGRFLAPIVPIQSRVGAGDSMMAGMVLSLSRGGSLCEAVRYGVAAGAAAVMTPGTELCRKEDTDRLAEELAQVGEVCP